MAPKHRRRRVTRLTGAALCLATALACQPAPTQTKPGAASATHAEQPAAAAAKEVRLVLWLTLDQFGPGYLERFEKHASPGGFARLLGQGAYFTNAHYAHAITETAPGHATLFTGASPARHGIIGNSWRERSSFTETTSVSDSAFPLVGVTQGAEKGRSPRKLLAPTLGDALLAANGRSKVIAVATKDRSAILPAGQKGKAYFLESAGFVTSRYYADALPAWVSRYNQEHPLEGHRGREWRLALPDDQYLRKNADDHAWERPPGALGRTFPHRLDAQGTLEGVIATTPFGDELSASFAVAALDAEGLGRDDAPDLLSLSLSATDAIGHSFGPESLEAEDNFVRLDRTLAKLLTEIDARVGADHTLVVVSADHGAPESPEALRSTNVAAERVLPSALFDDARAAARRRYRKPELVRAVTVPYVWLDRALVAQAQLDPATVARELAEDLKKSAPSVRYAASTWDPLPEGALEGRVRESIQLERSGDIYVVLEPHHLFMQHADMATTHGSPWPYDTHVPIILLGSGVPAGRFGRAVDPRAIAPTVASLLGVPAPAAASEAPIQELLPSQADKARSDTP